MKTLIPIINDLSFVFLYPSEETLKYFNPDIKLIDLEIEYVRLFINNYDEPIISLYATTYINPSYPSAVINSLSNIYSKLGLIVDKNFKERPDHISIILEFFGLLIESNIDKKILKNFFNNYILCFEPITVSIKQKTLFQIYIYAAEKLSFFIKKFKNG